MRTYFSFGLILRDIPNSITPQTTLRLLPIPVGLLVLPCTRQCRRPHPTPYALPLFPSCPGQRNRRRPVPVPVTGVRYNSLLWICTLNTLTWPHIKLCFPTLIMFYIYFAITKIRFKNLNMVVINVSIGKDGTWFLRGIISTTILKSSVSYTS